MDWDCFLAQAVSLYLYNGRFFIRCEHVWGFFCLCCFFFQVFPFAVFVTHTDAEMDQLPRDHLQRNLKQICLLGGNFVRNVPGGQLTSKTYLSAPHLTWPTFLRAAISIFFLAVKRKKVFLPCGF